MDFKKRKEEESANLKSMGICLIATALLIGLVVYFLPLDPSNYWLSEDGKQGFYALCSLFFFFGLYCLGAIWRRRHFHENQ